MGIYSIKDFIQSYVKAIATILNVGVVVVDKNLVRIAGTNVDSDLVGKIINHSGFYREIIESGHANIMTKTNNTTCKICEFNDDCEDIADIAYPIFYKGKVEGVIGLIAFTDKAKQSKAKLIRT